MTASLLPALEFRQASDADVARVYSLLKSSGEWMKEELGLGHWIPPYPEERIRSDVTRHRVFLGWLNGEPVATFTLVSEPPSTWAALPVRDALYLGKMAVRPDRSGGGIGKQSFSEARRLAREAGRGWLRLDVYDQSRHAVSFFSGLGCRTVGTAKTRRFTVVLMEIETC